MHPKMKRFQPKTKRIRRKSKGQILIDKLTKKYKWHKKRRKHFLGIPTKVCE